jgi:hypothetical protein
MDRKDQTEQLELVLGLSALRDALLDRGKDTAAGAVDDVITSMAAPLFAAMQS